MNSIRIYRVLLIIITVLLIGCDDQGETASDNNKPLWGVFWAYTYGNNPTGGNGINSEGWVQVLRNSTGFTFKVVAKDSVPMPDDSYLTLLDIPSFNISVSNFVHNFEINIGDSIIRPDRGCYLFGVNEMAFAGNAIGVTSVRGGITQDVAVAFVFTKKILNEVAVASEKWAKIDHTVLHELGHARGLNALSASGIFCINDNYIDHCYHRGQDSATCLMWGSVSYPIPQPFSFCEYHKHVLQNCLTSIVTRYSILDSCAYYP